MYGYTDGKHNNQKNSKCKQFLTQCLFHIFLKPSDHLPGSSLIGVQKQIFLIKIIRIQFYNKCQQKQSKPQDPGNHRIALNIPFIFRHYDFHCDGKCHCRHKDDAVTSFFIFLRFFFDTLMFPFIGNPDNAEQRADSEHYKTFLRPAGSTTVVHRYIGSDQIIV
mgnify:CR=1 FL=1